MKNFPQFVPEDFEPFFLPGLSHEEYHSDHSAINSSTLKIFEKSAAKVESHLLDRGDPEDSEATHFRLGRTLHAAVLEPARFAESLVTMPVFEGRTKKGEITTSLNCREVRDKKAQWLASLPPHAMVVSEKEKLQVEGMVNSIMSIEYARNLFMNGTPEISGYFRHVDTGIKAKIRPDFWDEEKGILLDVKTCKDSSWAGFSEAIRKYKYHLSMAMYADGIFQITGTRPSDCIFVAVENFPPYECAIYSCSERMLQAGHEDYSYYMDLLRYCLENNYWPSNQAARDSYLELIDLPEYYYKKKEKVEIYE